MPWSLPAACLLLTAASATPAGAQPTLDQAQTAVDNILAIGPAFSEAVAQSFTAGQSGALEEVDLWAARDNLTGSAWGDLMVDLIETDASGRPNGAVLATAVVDPLSFPLQAAPAPTTVIFPAPALIAAGQRYALALRAPGTTGEYDVGVQGGEADPYAGGEAFVDLGFGYESAAIPGEGPFADLAFRTFVPEPAALGQWAALLALLGLAPSRRVPRSRC